MSDQNHDLSRLSHEAALQKIAALTEENQALRTERDYMQAILDNIPGLICAKDIEGRLLVVNRPFEIRTGFTRQQMIGKTMEEFAGERDTTQFAENDHRIMEAQGPLQIEFSIYNPIFKKVLYYLTSGFQLRNAEGMLYAFGSISTDITLRKEAEQALHTSQLQMQAILENAPALIYIRSIDGHYVLVNQQFLQRTGKELHEVVGKTDHELFPPATAELYVEHHQTVIETHKALETEWSSSEPDPLQRRTFSTIMFPLYNSDKQIYAVGGISLEITLRRRAEEQMRLSQQQMLDVLDNSPAIISLKDLEGRYILVNRRFIDTAQRQLHEITGKTSHELFPQETANRIVLNDQKAIEAGAAIDREWTVFDPQRQSEQTYLTTTFPLRDAAGLIYAVCGMTMDITERRQVEEARRQTLTQQELIVAQEIALAELASPLLRISHQAVVMPLIGSLDARRTQQVIATLLAGVDQQKAEIAIVDITGVSVVDTHVANALLQAAQSVQLLGAQVILTGIRPEIAQTLVNLGTNLHGLMTLNSLQEGIDYALRRSKRNGIG